MSFNSSSVKMHSTMNTPLVYAISISAIAAVSDLRSSTIPNWLTLPPLVAAPAAYGIWLGWQYALLAVFSAILSGLVPYVLFRMRGMGGGDVKLFAALGAVTGFDPLLGVQIELVAFITAMISAASRLALSPSFRVRPDIRRQRPPEHSPPRSLLPQMKSTPVRLGGAILVATTIQLAPLLQA